MYSDKEKIDAMVKYIEWNDTGKFTSELFKEMKNVVMDNYIKPCPFCGNTDVRVLTADQINGDGGKWDHAVCCDATNGGCGSASGYRTDEDEAIKIWNSREKTNV